MNTSVRHRRYSIETSVLRVARWVVIVVAVLVTVIPVFYAFMLSIQPIERILKNPLAFIPPPSDVTLAPYRRVLSGEASGGFGLLNSVLNSLIVAVLVTVVALFCSVLGAYAATRLDFRGKKIANAVFLGTYVAPGIVIAVPLFIVFSRIGLQGSLGSLAFVYLAAAIPMSLYLLRDYFSGLPASVEESAAIDGAGRLRTIFAIVLPMARPGLLAAALFVFTQAWNEYMLALLWLIQNQANWTGPLALARLTSFGTPQNILMAGSVVLTIPVVVLFVVFQKNLVSGMTAGAEKG